MVLSLSAKGLTHGEISAHLAGVYGAEVSKQTTSTITGQVMEGMAEWQNRPLDRVYPVVFVDAINVKIRDGKVANRPVYVVMAVTVEGTRDILGIWAGDGGEGAKYWLQVFTELKNRGLDDVLMLVCDGLKGLPDAVGTVWPRTIVQTCIVHRSRKESSCRCVVGLSLIFWQVRDVGEDFGGRAEASRGGRESDARLFEDRMRVGEGVAYGVQAHAEYLGQDRFGRDLPRVEDCHEQALGVSDLLPEHAAA
jgi:hypothetical protein